MADLDPITRKEMFYDAILGNTATSALPDPVTREEVYLKDIAENGGGGGEGTRNYNQLINRPKVNNVVLEGDKTTEDLIPIGTGLQFNEDGELEAVGGGGGSAELTDDLTTSVTVGGIQSGTTYEEGTSLETIFRNLLNPVAYPTLTNPSVSLAGSGSKLLETGATLAVTLTATFSRGSINPAYGTSGYRSGAVQGYTLNSGTEQSENTWAETVSANNRTFKCSARYAAGEQPKDSVGNNYSTPLPAGSVESGTVTYDFVDAMWANTANIATVAKLSLVAKSTKQRDMTFPAQTVANPEIFDIPASWTVTAVQVKNDLSGAWEDASSQFTVTDTTHDNAGGTSTAYKRYTFNLGIGTGSRQIRVKWN